MKTRIYVDTSVISGDLNLRMGYPMLEIRSPREVLHEEDI